MREIKREFKSLVKENKLDIFSIEVLILDNVEEYKKKLTIEIEELLQQ